MNDNIGLISAVPDIPSRVNTSRDSGAVPKQKKIKVQHHNKTVSQC